MKRFHHAGWAFALALLAVACTESGERMVGGPPSSSISDGGSDGSMPTRWTGEPITTCDVAQHAPEGAPCDFQGSCDYWVGCPFSLRQCRDGELGPSIPYAMPCNQDAGAPDAGR